MIQLLMPLISNIYRAIAALTKDTISLGMVLAALIAFAMAGGVIASAYLLMTPVRILRSPVHQQIQSIIGVAEWLSFF